MESKSIFFVDIFFTRWKIIYCCVGDHKSVINGFVKPYIKYPLYLLGVLLILLMSFSFIAIFIGIVFVFRNDETYKKIWNEHSIQAIIGLFRNLRKFAMFEN